MHGACPEACMHARGSYLLEAVIQPASQHHMFFPCVCLLPPFSITMPPKRQMPPHVQFHLECSSKRRRTHLVNTGRLERSLPCNSRTPAGGYAMLRPERNRSDLPNSAETDGIRANEWICVCNTASLGCFTLGGA